MNLSSSHNIGMVARDRRRFLVNPLRHGTGSGAPGPPLARVSPSRRRVQNRNSWRRTHAPHMSRAARRRQEREGLPEGGAEQETGGTRDGPVPGGTAVLPGLIWLHSRGMEHPQHGGGGESPDQGRDVDAGPTQPPRRSHQRQDERPDPPGTDREPRLAPPARKTSDGSISGPRDVGPTQVPTAFITMPEQIPFTRNPSASPTLREKTKKKTKKKKKRRERAVGPRYQQEGENKGPETSVHGTATPAPPVTGHPPMPDRGS